MGTPHLTASDLREVARSGHALSQSIAKPCGCGRKQCTRGEHVWRATKDAEPGPPASSLEPSRGGGEHGIVIVEGRPNRETDHQRIKLLAARIYRDSEQLQILIDNWRPDREVADNTAHPDEHCTHHMAMIGKWEPRHASGLCRWCHDFLAQQQLLPPREILQARHEGRTITTKMIDEFRKTQTQVAERKYQNRRTAA